MGDSRIYVHVARALITSSSWNESDPFTCVIQCLPADSSVRDLFETVTVKTATSDSSLLSLVQQHQSSTVDKGVSIWDCTTYPPKNITDWPTQLYHEQAGLKSRTLYDAGWFPSAKLLVLPDGVDIVEAWNKISTRERYEDTQYNKIVEKHSHHDEAPQLQLANQQNGSLPLPSQLLSAVSTRFDDSMRSDEDFARAQRRVKHIERADKERERCRKLEERIRRLDDMAGKGSSVSQQVQRMLIKSRATGRKELDQQDRLYFQCFILRVDDKMTETVEFRYFSPQDTVGRVASSFDVPNGQQSEFIVQVVAADSDSESFRYRRLPVLMRLYEAISKQLVREFDKIIIRVFDQSTEESTPLLSDYSDTCETGEQDIPNATLNASLHKESPHNTVHSVEDESYSQVVTGSIYTELLEELDRVIGKDKKKKLQSAAAVKVRQMQMKSKANGDTKRAPKMEDRFFLELVTTIPGRSKKITVSPVFLNRNDLLNRLRTDVAPLPAGPEWRYEFLVRAVHSDSLMRITDTEMRLSDAEKHGLLKCYDQIILRIYQDLKL